ncbi:acetate--CoA ligase family protein [Geoglobus acetivorans]|uniref:acetate--CoA ligase (ADP-forming) n=1 Tax=Geoglobus acetivorans TaxID=565033 RepID=A0A0A7GCU4_GEOAI|nr:acetyl-CoA synthetase [Geoglobus acetivorans]
MRTLDLRESLALLRKYGIPVADTFFVSSEDDVLGLKDVLPLPCVVKPNTGGHKSELGVFKDLRSVDEILHALNELGCEAGIQRMVHGFEIFLGAKRDRFFGHVLALGTGGVFAELFEDISFRLMPITWQDFDDMMDETKLSAVSRGFRNFGFSRKKLYSIVKKFERMVIEEGVVEADINPLIADGDEILAVDARIIL